MKRKVAPRFSIVVAILAFCGTIAFAADDAAAESLTKALASALNEHKKVASGEKTQAPSEKPKDPAPGEPRTAIISQKQKPVVLGKHRLEWEQTILQEDYKDVKLSAYNRGWFYYTKVEAKPLKPIPIADADATLRNDPSEIGKALCFIIQRIPVELAETFDAKGDPTDLTIHKIDIHSGPISSLSGSLTEGVTVVFDIRAPRNSGMLIYQLLYEPKTSVDREKSGQQLNLGRPDYTLRGLEPQFSGGNW